MKKELAQKNETPKTVKKTKKAEKNGGGRSAVFETDAAAAVGPRITGLREEKNLSVNRLANITGVSQSYLRDVELGLKNPSINFLSLICESLGISLRDFFGTDAFRIPSALSETQKASPYTGEALSATIERLTPAQQDALNTLLHLFLSQQS